MMLPHVGNAHSDSPTHTHAPAHRVGSSGVGTEVQGLEFSIWGFIDSRLQLARFLIGDSGFNIEGVSRTGGGGLGEGLGFRLRKSTIWGFRVGV